MKWDDIKGSPEFAEALSLAASLVAAVIALRDAQKKNEEESDGKEGSEPSPGDDLSPQSIDLSEPEPLVSLVHNPNKIGVKIEMSPVVIALAVVVSIQMLIILYILVKVF